MMTGLAVAMNDGRNCPRFVCERCGEAIDDAVMANALWASINNDRGNGPPVFVHKLCTRAFESAQYPARYLAEELHVFLAQLLHNTGLRGNRLMRAVAYAKERASWEPA